MGAWGAGTFQNDAAQDWLAEFLVNGELDDALRAAIDAHDYRDVDGGSAALAAAEVVAAIRTGPGLELPTHPA